MQKSQYKMTISGNTIDKLGIKMYDKPSAVIAELVANSYDADAENVHVKLPLGRLLSDAGDARHEIVITDDGIGMSPDIINDFYLTVGSDRRKDPKRGNTSPNKRRLVMGRKGIGKLAPFGICREIDVQSSGGQKTDKGYKTAHFILNYDSIVSEVGRTEDGTYTPDKGEKDGTYSETTGTSITLRNFYRRKTPNAETFGRQMARRFRSGSDDFAVKFIDEQKPACFSLSPLSIEYEPETEIRLDDRPVELADGRKLPVRGWIAYSKKPHKNPDMTGVRIYARGKIVSNTSDFGINVGFRGEHNIRSYMVGEIHADWIDDDEDYIRSDRQDILWDAEPVSEFQKWGMEIMKDLGKKALKPMRKKTWEMFLERSNLSAAIEEKFHEPALRRAAMNLGKTIGQIANRDDLADDDYIDDLRRMVLTVAPHKLLVEKLRNIADAQSSDDPLSYVLQIFDDASIAENASMGQVASERVKVLAELEGLITNNPDARERDLQQLIERSPWLIDPRWTSLSSNQSFRTMRRLFEAWYHKNRGAEIVTTALSGSESRRPDFIMLHTTARIVEVVEIKAPGHKIDNGEFDRILEYRDRVVEFLSSSDAFRDEFVEVRIALVCDGIRLSSAQKLAHEALSQRRALVCQSWGQILADSRKTHEDFLAVNGN